MVTKKKRKTLSMVIKERDELMALCKQLVDCKQMLQFSYIIDAMERLVLIIEESE